MQLIKRVVGECLPAFVHSHTGTCSSLHDTATQAKPLDITDTCCILSQKLKVTVLSAGDTRIGMPAV